MGLSPAHMIEGAADYVLRILRDQRQITYRQFYDGTNDTATKIEQAIVSDEGRGWYSAEGLIDIAVSQLEQQGVVETTPLDDILADGEPNYSIALTALGADALAGKVKLTYWDSE